MDIVLSTWHPTTSEESLFYAQLDENGRNSQQ